MNDITLYMLIGPDGSGKAHLASKLFYKNPNAKIVSVNDIRMEVCGNLYDQTNNKAVFNQVYDSIINELDEKNDVIYISTNCKPQYRKKIIDICNGKYDKLVGYVSTRDLVNCIKNNKNHINIRRIENDYVDLRKRPPHVFEGFDILKTFE